jgi:enoyl-ACP reductase-like protein
VNIDLNGRLALIGGSQGVLTSAIRDAMRENGAEIVDVDPTLDASDTAHGEPFVLVLVSKGAEGVPQHDTDFGAERAEFVRTIRQLAPQLKRVVLLFSSAGLVPVKGFAEFSAGQAGLASISRTLAMEFGPEVCVSAVAVGAYDTPGEVRTPRFLSHAAVKRPARLSEIVAAVLFLADPGNAYMTGHTLNVDGGWAAGYARNF